MWQWLLIGASVLCALGAFQERKDRIRCAMFAMLTVVFLALAIAGESVLDWFG